MSRPFAVDLGVFALKNVPDLGHDVARENGVRIDAEQRTDAVATETWGDDVKAGVRAGSPGLEWWTEGGQSVMIGHDPKRRRVIARHVLTGASSPRIKGISDERDALAELHEDIATEGRYWLIALHTAPIRPKVGIWAVLAAEAAHAVTRRRLRRFIRRLSRGLPVFIAGDFNTKRLLPNARLAGGEVGNGIVHVEYFHGKAKSITRPTVRSAKLVSDHLAVLLGFKVF